jgi:lantibiotic modifying enzyme
MTSEYLDVAHQLGNRLVRTAIWHGDRCNWMGVRPIANVRGGIREAVAALNGDLYSGTSGIALFLAELHAFTGDEVVARTALGAIRHAIARSDIGDTMGSGLYDGRLGMALAAAQVGTLLHEDELLERAGVLAEHAQQLADNFDLISERAGAIVGLIVLCKLLDDHRLLEAGVRIGDELVAMAVEHLIEQATPVDLHACALHQTLVQLVAGA